MEPIIIMLHWKEAAVAAHMGTLRQIEDAAKGWKHKGGDDANERVWQIGSQGAVSEWVAAKWLGTFPAGYSTSNEAGDLRKGFEVRSVSKAGSHLHCREGDDPEAHFMLVYCKSALEHHILGWAYGSAIMEPANWQQRYGQFWLPHEQLQPMEHFREHFIERIALAET